MASILETAILIGVTLYAYVFTFTQASQYYTAGVTYGDYLKWIVDRGGRSLTS